MSRFHVHIAVADLQANIDFYTALFGTAPSVVEADYAKWMLDDPKVNFAVSSRGLTPGLDHVGIQAETAAELAEVEDRLTGAGIAGMPQKDTTCCYARSDKYWTADPQGVPWETFHTLASAPTYRESDEQPAKEAASCCAPAISKCC